MVENIRLGRCHVSFKGKLDSKYRPLGDVTSLSREYVDYVEPAYEHHDEQRSLRYSPSLLALTVGMRR
jgi:hypothetical protein